MRSTFYRFMSIAALAIASCVGFAGFASAADRYDVVSALRFSVAEVGAYGAESAKCKAELAHMATIKFERTGSLNGLTRESNGYRLTAMVTETESGVAGGKTGVGTGPA